MNDTEEENFLGGYEDVSVGEGDSGTVTSSLASPKDGTSTGRHGLTLIAHGEVWTPAVIQRVVTLVILMTVTLLGNVVIIVILSCSRYRKLSNRVNIFIVNLAIGDLTVCCVTMTTEVVFVAFEGAWVLGYAACKGLLYAQMVTLASTTFILTAMSFDRYVAICRPLSLGASSSASRAKTMVSVSWMMAFVFASPQLVIFTQRAEGVYPDGEIKYACRSTGYTAWWQRKTYFTFLTVYILVVPAVVISFCYINVVRVVWKQGKEVVASKEQVALRKTIKDVRFLNRAKVKTIKMTLSIICSFIACWTPYFIVHLIRIWSEYSYKIHQTVLVFAETMALFNSAINPVLYGVFNVRLKHGLAELCCCYSDDQQRAAWALHSESGTTTNGRYRTSQSAELPGFRTPGGAGTLRNHRSSTDSCSRIADKDEFRVTAPNRTRILKNEDQRDFKLRVRFVNIGSCRLNDVIDAALVTSSDGDVSCSRSNVIRSPTDSNISRV